MRQDLQELRLGNAEVVGERRDLLKRTVVQVEADPDQPPFTRRDERVLTSDASLEQQLAFQDG